MAKVPTPVAHVEAATPDAIKSAAERLQCGQLVAFPTETVYGLGADATNDSAIAAVFEAKQRPAFNPLICHFPSIDAVHRMLPIPDPAASLAEAFWPGSLSIVVSRPADCPISRLASAGLDTVAVRVPDHPIASALLEISDSPIAAPSANRSGRLSPTRASDVLTSLTDVDLLILDGGTCEVGLESTVVGMAPDGSLEILRDGGICREDLEKAAGQPLRTIDKLDEIRAPGMLARHYEPTLPLRINAIDVRPDEVLIGFGPQSADRATPAFNLSPSGNLREAAANLFAMLHDAETKAGRGIAVAPIPDEGLGRAINDRLRRGATDFASDT